MLETEAVRTAARDIETIETWCVAIGASFARFGRPGSAGPGAATRVCWSESRPGWVRVISGTPRIAGLESGRLHPGSIVPMARGIWLDDSTPFTVEYVSAEAVALTLSAANLRELAAVLLRPLEEMEKTCEATARRAVKGRMDHDRQLTAATILELAGAAATPYEQSDPLLAATRIVSAWLEASSLRTRQVLLDGEWWRTDSGGMVAFGRAGRSPVALIPKRKLSGHWRYELIDPADGAARAVTPELAATLEPIAVSFCRPLVPGAAAGALLRPALRPYKRDLKTIILCGVVLAMLGMVAPAATSWLFAQAIPNGDRALLLQIILGLTAAFIGTAMFSIAQSLAMVRVQSGLTVHIQCGLWDRVLRLRPSFFRRYTAGDLWMRLEAVDAIRRRLTMSGLTGALTGLFSLFNLAVMAYFSPQLAAMACIAGSGMAAATVLAARQMYGLEKARQNLEGSLSGLLVQLVGGVSKLRVAGAEQRAFARWGKPYSEKQELAIRIRRVSDNLQTLHAIVPVIGSALILLWVLTAGKENFSTGTYLAFMAAFNAFVAGITGLSDTVTGSGIATLWSRCLPILREETEDALPKKHPGKLAGHIQFQAVEFRYRDDGPATLQDISFEVKPGECVALAGASGSGKSTILNLLLGVDTPVAGRVSIDGQDLSTIDISAVRRQFGVVGQDSRFISQTIFETLASGSNCTVEEAWEACRTAEVALEIEQMPMGMDTVISEGGTNLSGGQRQRILIARALARKPAVLILDEATSALDSTTQQKITRNLDPLAMTRIVVAQRLSTIRNADRIYVIDSGRIVQSGRYEELAAVPGVFARLLLRPE